MIKLLLQKMLSEPEVFPHITALAQHYYTPYLNEEHLFVIIVRLHEPIWIAECDDNYYLDEVVKMLEAKNARNVFTTNKQLANSLSGKVDVYSVYTYDRTAAKRNPELVPLRRNDLSFIINTYNISQDELYRMYNNHHILGYYYCDELIGYIGKTDMDSIQFLYIKKKYRQCNFVNKIITGTLFQFSDIISYSLIPYANNLAKNALAKLNCKDTNKPLFLVKE